jgi:hypothetical protein
MCAVITASSKPHTPGAATLVGLPAVVRKGWAWPGYRQNTSLISTPPAEFTGPRE